VRNTAKAAKARTYRPRGGESFAELRVRVGRAVERIVSALRDDGTALVATHAGPLHALLEVLGDTEAAALKVKFLTASITRFQRRHGVWSLARLNETAL